MDSEEASVLGVSALPVAPGLDRCEVNGAVGFGPATGPHIRVYGTVAASKELSE